MRHTHSTLIMPLVLAGLLVTGPARPLVAHQPPPLPTTGSDMFKAYCASCHGLSAHGDGPIARYLRVRPADLTQVTKHYGGAFPTERVRQIIDGRQTVRAHGDSQMPVWGDVFKRSGIDVSEATVGKNIDKLVAYVESLQEKPAK
jgi:mono/diheme cytochrome c family protein